MAEPVHVAIVLAKLIRDLANVNTSVAPYPTLEWTGKVKLTALDRLKVSAVIPANTVMSCSARPTNQVVNTSSATRKG